MKTKSIITTLLIAFALTAQSQYPYEWSAQFGGSNTDYAYGIAVDNDGNVISGGEFRNTVDFDPAEETEANLTVEVSILNAYISKLDANGAYVWAKKIEGEARVLDVHTDNDNNVYACGRFRETVVFPNGKGSVVFTSNGMYDCFLAKYTAAGDFLWVIQIGGEDQDFMNSIAVDEDGDLVVSGEFTSTVDFDPGSGVAEMVQDYTTNAWDSFVAKYDSDGNYIWARQFAGEGIQDAYGVSVTSEGDIIVAGEFSGPTDFDPGAGELIMDNGSELDWQGYIVKLNDAGELIWAKSYGSTGHEWLYGMATDEQDNIYVTGAFGGTADFDPGEGIFEMTSEGFVNDPYIVKLDTNGDFVWAGQYAGAGDGGSYAIDVVGGAIYTAGYATGTCDFDPGAEVNTESSGAAGYYGFVAVLDTQGQYLWSDRLGNGANDFSYAIVADESALYVTGTFRGTSVWFGNTFFNATGLDDVYVTKIQHPTSGVEETNNASIHAYPNPANDFILLTGTTGNATMILCDATGRIVMREKVLDNSSIDVSRLQPGVYVMRVGGVTERIVICD